MCAERDMDLVRADRAQDCFAGSRGEHPFMLAREGGSPVFACPYPAAKAFYQDIS
jgi:hypothetical protein